MQVEHKVSIPKFLIERIHEAWIDRLFVDGWKVWGKNISRQGEGDTGKSGEIS